jgi:predicted enzyme related to lactoylglutathione lyase
MTMNAPRAVIYAKHLDRMVAFYAGVVGLDEIARADDHVVLARGEQRLVIVAIPALIASTFEIDDPPRRREDAAVKPVFAVNDLAAARAAAISLGGMMDGPELEWRFDGARVRDGHDPEGNVIQLQSA